MDVERHWTGLDDPLVGPALADLERLYRELYGPGAHREMARHPPAVFAPPHGGVVALTGAGELVAAGAFRPWRAGAPGVAEVKRVWTRPDRRRRGLGRQVMAALEAGARQAGYTRIHLSTGWRQQDAVALYRALGYRPLYDPDADPRTVGELDFDKPLTRPDA